VLGIWKASVWVVGAPRGFRIRPENPIRSSGRSYSTRTPLAVRSTTTRTRRWAGFLNQPAWTNVVWGTSMKFSTRWVTSFSNAVTM
jgi:hypothetical protein